MMLQVFKANKPRNDPWLVMLLDLVLAQSFDLGFDLIEWWQIARYAAQPFPADLTVGTYNEDRTLRSRETVHTCEIWPCHAVIFDCRFLVITEHREIKPMLILELSVAEACVGRYGYHRSV